MDQDQIKMAEELLFSEKKKLSALKLLYQGIFDTPAYFPFPEPPSHERKKTQEYIGNLKGHLDRHLDPVRIDKEAKIPEETIRHLAEVGLFGISVPQEHGGLGMDQYSYCKAIEEVASRCGSTAILINAHQSIGLKGILLFGNEMQKKRFLPPPCQRRADRGILSDRTQRRLRRLRHRNAGCLRSRKESLSHQWKKTVDQQRQHRLRADPDG